jgi:hypothetical protein
MGLGIPTLREEIDSKRIHEAGVYVFLKKNK